MKQLSNVCVINPDYENLHDFVASIDENTTFAPEEKIFHQRNRIYRHLHNGMPLSVKCFRVPNYINRYAYTYLRASKAKRSYTNSLRLMQAGIPVPAPIAYREVYRGGLLAESYYISAFLDECHEVRQWETSADADRIIDGVAQLMARLHSAGIFFRDFSPGNILYDKEWNFYLVDVNRIDFNCHKPQVLMRNFRAIHADIDQVVRLAKAYCKYTPFTDIDATDIIEAAQLQKQDYISEKRWHRFFKRFFRQ